jgi:outer membrane protein assembly complex protein YaeT
MLPLLLSAQQTPPAPPQNVPPGDETYQTSNPALGTISAYLGLPVREIRFTGVPLREQDHLRELMPQKVGHPLDRDLLRDGVKILFDTGLFADIRVEAEKNDGQVTLIFSTIGNYFVGSVTVEGEPDRPSANQLVSATKLQLGEIFAPEKLERANKNIQQVMSDNGFYRSAVTHDEHSHPETSQMDVVFRVTAGPPAVVGEITVTGAGTYSKGQLEDIAHMHPGDRVTADRVSSALQRIRKKYLKQNRLLAQVSIAARIYRPDANQLDFTFLIDPGPSVDIAVEGFKVRKSVLRKRVPVYEENALDDDLLNEGRRNLLDYLQSRGYFDAKVGIKKQSDPAKNELRAVYVIDPGVRHKLVKVIITGNKYFDQTALRSRMQVQPATRLLSSGRFSQSLLASDLNGLQDLYRANGFRKIQIKSTVLDNYQGVEKRLAITLEITEGPQTLVGDVKITGNSKVPTDDLQSRIDTAPGQPYSDYRLASDRDTILNYYFNNGFPDAILEVSTHNDSEDRIAVSFSIQEGEQFFVDQVLVSGLVHTRPGVVQRKLHISPSGPLSQEDMLRTQASLYDLGIFSQVDTAVQNPNGQDPSKNVLIDIREAKRYTFNYGLGLEVQTGQPSASQAVPQGKTGISPRVSLEVTRLNFRGLDHTIIFKGHLGRLQQRALISYNAPGWFDNDKLSLSFTGFYDNTLDITTFTSKRLEGSAQIHQCFGSNEQCVVSGRPPTEAVYSFTYRRVQASNLVITPNLIPILSQPTRVGIPALTIIRDRRDSPLESTKGTYTTLDAGVAASYFGSEADFSRILFQNSTYHTLGKNRPPGKRFVFARSTRLGIQNPFGKTVILEPNEAPPTGASLIPLPERFLSGGGNSHRGFGLNQAGPRDLITGFPLGGSALFLNQFELRLPPVDLPYVGNNISFALFHDMGNVFAKQADMFDNLLRWRQKNPDLCLHESTYTQCDFNYVSHAVGIGVHYKTPIGPVRLDFGYNLNPPAFPSFQTVTNTVNDVSSSTQFVPQRAGHFNFFFSIGQAF